MWKEFFFFLLLFFRCNKSMIYDELNLKIKDITALAVVEEEISQGMESLNEYQMGS